MAEDALVKMPEGVEISLHLFIVSDAEGLDMEFIVSGLPVMPTKFQDMVSIGALKGIDKLASDWRVMTRAEIADYKERERRNARDDHDADEE